MRKVRLILLLVLVATTSFGQQSNFDLNSIKFKGLGLRTTKKEIVDKFGQGKQVETNYECGFFTNDQPNGPYYQLVYTGFNFIGSDKEGFYLQSVDFDLNGKVRLNYADKVLSGQTTKDDFIKMFGDIARKHFENPDNHGIILIAQGRDDGARFTFKNGVLVRFEYWTPC